MPLDKEIYRIEQDYFVREVYDEKAREHFHIVDDINKILDKYSDGMIYDVHACTLEGNILYSNLTENNKRKFVNLGERDFLYDRWRKFRDLMKYPFQKQYKYILDPAIYHKNRYEKHAIRLSALISGCRIINLRRELLDLGYELNEVWYDQYGISYKDIHDAISEYKSTSTKDERILAAKKTWGYSFFIRDFYTANIWFDKYIDIETDLKKNQEAGKCWRAVGG